MNSLKLWLTLRVHGRQAYEELIDRQLKLSKTFVACVKASENFELAVPPMLPIVTFRLKPAGRSPQQLAADHDAIVDEITREGGRWISETKVRGDSVLRMMVISYLTEERHLQGLETALTNAAKQLTAREKIRAQSGQGELLEVPDNALGLVQFTA